MATNDDNRDNGSGGLRNMVRSINSRNYRLFFEGQGMSLVGTWMTRVATSWLVYRLTGSAVLLGIVGFSGQIPVLILGPFAGVWVDRWDRHQILLITQALAAVQSLALAVLAITGVIQVWHIIALQAFQGMINSFDTPARQAFVVEMVESKNDLGNAIALNSSMVNMARPVGMAAAGLLIAATGEGWCFLIDGGSYIAVIASLLAMRFAAKPARTVKHARVWTDLKEGFAYAWRYQPIRATLMLLALISLMGMPYSVLLPVFAKDILHGGPATLGFLGAAPGIGALGGAVFLASRRSVVGLGRVIPMAASLFGAALIVFGFSHLLYASLAILLFIGFGFMVQMASSNTILQTVVEEGKRGRVMSMYTIAFMGMAPFGSLLAGFSAQRIGAQHTVMIGGTVCILGALVYASRLPALREIVRPLYVSMGLLGGDPSVGPEDAPALPVEAAERAEEAAKL
jgi:MFS family permease